MSGRFLTKLAAQKNDHDKWELVEPLWYESMVVFSKPVVVAPDIELPLTAVGRLVIPVGFHTDFASVPRLPIIYMLDGDCGHEAAVVHDYLYYTGIYPRAVADAVFQEALLACGESRFRAWSMWLGVRVGGFKAWSKYRSKA